MADSPFGGGGMDWASIPGKPRADLPPSVLYNGREVAIYTFAQVDRLGKKALKERAMNLRDLVGAQNLPRFSPGFQEQQMVAWILEAQTIVAAASGVPLTVTDLGAPKGGDGVGAFLAHLQNAPSPQHQAPPPQAPPHFQQPPPQFQQPQFHPQQQPPQPPANDVYVLDFIQDVRTNAQGIATHFLCKWVGRPLEAASWEPAEQIHEVAPKQVVEFKQLLQQQQRQSSPPPRAPPPPHIYHQQPPYQQPPYQPQSQSRPFSGGPPPPAAYSPSSASSPLRPDQESDAVRDAARRRNQGSFTFG